MRTVSCKSGLHPRLQRRLHAAEGCKKWQQKQGHRKLLKVPPIHTIDCTTHTHTERDAYTLGCHLLFRFSSGCYTNHRVQNMNHTPIRCPHPLRSTLMHLLSSDLSQQQHPKPNPPSGSASLLTGTLKPPLQDFGSGGTKIVTTSVHMYDKVCCLQRVITK